MDLIVVILLVVLCVGICLTYKIKNVFLRWILIVTPPLLMIPLYWVPWDILTVLFWTPAIVAFLWSGLSLTINVVRIILRKLRGKPQINYVRARFFRPVLTIAIFLSVNFFVNQSLHSADEFAKETARKVQAEANTNGICPERIEDWELDEWDPNISIIRYGKYGTKYSVRYRPSENKKEFEISVRHNIDEALFISGGVEKELIAELSVEGRAINVPIK
jgi:hypothetical protein